MEPGDRLSEGAVVRASILARLLGIRLLRLEAEIVLLPARVTAATDGTSPTNARRREDVRGLEDARRLVQRAARTLEDSPSR